MNKKLFTTGGLIALCIAVAVLTVGCKTPQEKLAEKATEKALETSTGGQADVDIDSDSGEFTVTGDDGTTITSSSEAPEDWPSDVPLYDDATVTGSFTSTSDGGFAGWITLGTSDSISQVADWYKDELSGWTEVSSYSSSTGDATGQMLSYEKGNRSLLINISEQDGETTVTLTIGNES